MITITWKCNAIGHIPVAYPTCKLPIFIVLLFFFKVKMWCVPKKWKPIFGYIR